MLHALLLAVVACFLLLGVLVLLRSAMRLDAWALAQMTQDIDEAGSSRL
jgi:hypothetical protein